MTISFMQWKRRDVEIRCHFLSKCELKKYNFCRTTVVCYILKLFSNYAVYMSSEAINGSQFRPQNKKRVIATISHNSELAFCIIFRHFELTSRKNCEFITIIYFSQYWAISLQFWRYLTILTYFSFKGSLVLWIKGSTRSSEEKSHNCKM